MTLYTKVIGITNYKKAAIRDIRVGGVFKYNENIFLKVDSRCDITTALCISNNSMYLASTFNNDTVVDLISPSSKITVEPCEA